MVLKPGPDTTMPVPTPPSTTATSSPPEIWHAVIGTGQSLSSGCAANLPHPTPPAPNALKLHDATGAYDITNFLAPSLQAVPLTEPFRPRDYRHAHYPNNVDGQTPHSGMAGTLDRLGWGRGDASARHRSVHACVGRGGATMSEISKGGTGPEYAASVFEARAFGRLAARAGAALVFEAVVLTHGEADAILGNREYGAQVLRMQADYARDLMAISGQDHEPLLVLSQQNTNPPVRDLHCIVMEEMWRVQGRSGGRVVCSGPKYQYGYVDGLHFPIGGYNRLGEQYGRVLHQCVVEKREFKPLRPRRARMVSARSVRVELEVPVRPLRWNDVLPKVHRHGHSAFGNGRGFEARDAEGKELEIESVWLDAEEDAVSVHLVEAPFQKPLSLGYAVTQQGDGFGPGFCGGNEYGRMGHVSDSADDGFMEKMMCSVEQGSHVLHCDEGWQKRAVYDMVEPGSYVIVGIDAGDSKRAFMDKAYAGTSMKREVTVRHDLRNYCVSFLMDVEG